MHGLRSPTPTRATFLMYLVVIEVDRLELWACVFKLLPWYPETVSLVWIFNVPDLRRAAQLAPFICLLERIDSHSNGNKPGVRTHDAVVKATLRHRMNGKASSASVQPLTSSHSGRGSLRWTSVDDRHAGTKASDLHSACLLSFADRSRPVRKLTRPPVLRRARWTTSYITERCIVATPLYEGRPRQSSPQRAVKCLASGTDRSWNGQSGLKHPTRK